MKNFLLILILSVSAITFSSCDSKIRVDGDGVSVVTSGDTTTPPVKPVEPRVALNWENTTAPHPERKPWSDFTSKHIEKNLATYSKATDILKICPKFNSLTSDLKIKALGEFVVAIIYYESGYNPLSRMVETTMGIDPITGMQVASEGLLQLSYQDVNSYKNKIEACRFDFKKDKNLPLAERSILNPIINLECGLNILKYQVKTHGAFMLEKNVYWAVIKINGKYTKIPEIKARVLKYAPKCAA